MIASHASSGLREFLLGSVAAHCCAHCPRPVLVLHVPRHGAAQRPGLLDRLASAAAFALGGGGGEGPQAARAGGEGGATGVGGLEQAQADAQAPASPACSLGRNIVLAVDDSGGWVGGRVSGWTCGW